MLLIYEAIKMRKSWSGGTAHLLDREEGGLDGVDEGGKVSLRGYWCEKLLACTFASNTTILHTTSD